MRCDDCGTTLYAAGAIVPAGMYVRVDDGSFRKVTLKQRGRLPASFDGHVAEYRSATGACICERRHAAAVIPAPAIRVGGAVPEGRQNSL